MDTEVMTKPTFTLVHALLEDSLLEVIVKLRYPASVQEVPL